MKYRKVGIARGFILIILLLQVIFISGSSATDTNPQRSFTPNSSHEVIVGALSWKAYTIDCAEGIVLSGSFEVSCDGDLYLGDEQKYDDWAPESIQFYILNETEYSKFVDRASFTPSFVREDESHLTWQFEIPLTGLWYVVYHNTAIYMMTVSGTIAQSGGINTTLLVTIILSSSLVALGVFCYLKKRE
ncbi:MAG: hypothetical protein RTV72_08175 [Candidatus Thorarchaeota archaeon]